MPLNSAEILLEQGVIDEEQLRNLKKKANREGRTFLEQLIVDQVCSEEDVAQNLSIGMGLPLVYLTQLRIPGYVAKILPRERALSLKAIPVSLKRENDAEVLYAAFFDPTDADAVKEVELAAGRSVKVVIAALSDIKNAIARYNVALNVKKRPSAHIEAVKPVEEEPELPPLPEVADAAAASDFEIDLGVDAVESVVQTPLSPPPLPQTESVTAEKQTGEFSVSGFDLDFEIEAVDEVPSGEKVAFQRSEISFEDEDFALDLEKPEQSTETAANDKQNQSETEESFDFLSINSNALSQDDSVIELKREESKKAKQAYAWGVEDLDFKEDGDLEEEKKPSVATGSDNLEFEIPLETSGGTDFSSRNPEEEDDDFNLDFAFETNQSTENSSSDQKENVLEDFNFDFEEAIPPAPKLEEQTSFGEADKRPTKEFEIKFDEEFSFEELENARNEINNEPLTETRVTPAASAAPSAPEPVQHPSTTTAPQLAKLDEIARKIDDGVDFNFDDVVADLDRLLEGGCDIKDDGSPRDGESVLPRELCEALLSIADEAGETVSAHEVDRIYEMMTGRRPDAEDERTKKLRTLFKDRIQKFIDQI